MGAATWACCVHLNMASLWGKVVLVLAIQILILIPWGKTADTSWQVGVPGYANKMAEAFVSLMNKATALDDLTKFYEDPTGASMKPVLGENLVKQMAADLSATFKRKTEALKWLVDVAESAVANYSYNPLLKMDDVHYVDIKNLGNLKLEHNPRFHVEVNLSTSAVHIPLEIYEGYPNILNDLKWTKVLNDAFKHNQKNFPDLHWQYFGSQTGMLRLYPASKRKEPPAGIPDLYDVRRRPWYIQSSTSPKDMLIMIDTSGSVHGQTLEIMKMAVKTLLNTLGENDYVNVARFSKDLGWVSCINTFVQANVVNKLILFEGINSLVDKDMANYGQALEFAFKEFEKFENEKIPSDGSECHKVIMFFTDGGTEDPSDVILQYNKNKQVRIFTFAIGPHAVPVHTIKAMACDNKGYFTTISAMAAIRTKIQEYVQVLSRPLVLSGQKHFQWTNYYLDAMGLGMVTTVSLPVFNRSAEAHNQTIVGVMGLDIPVQELEVFAPYRKLGPNGYPFAINSNGLIVFHPDMKTKGEYLDDPPDLDMLDLEENTEPLQQLRRDMINREKGNIMTRTVELTPDLRYASRQKKWYYYNRIKMTSFSLALVVPHDKQYYLSVSGMDISRGLDDLPEGGGAFVAPWKFCTNPANLSIVSDIAMLSALIQSGSECENDMVQHLLWDIQKTKTVPRTWRLILQNRQTFPFKDHVICHFIGTEGGLTRVYPPSALKKFQDVQDPWKAQYYRRALYGDNSWIFSADVENSVNGSEGVITAVRSINIHLGDKGNYKPAVVGIQFTEKSLFELMTEGQFEDLNLNLRTPIVRFKKGQIPCSADLFCYLVDDGGYIISSNHEDRLAKTNKFLGDIDPELMWFLRNRTIYLSKQTYNYQGVCFKSKSSRGSASTFRRNIPLLNLMSSFNLHQILDAAAWFYLKFNLWSWVQSFFATPSDAMLEFGAVKKGTERCVTVQKHFYFSSKISLVDEFRCGNCSRKVSAHRLLDTNLLFVAINTPCTLDSFCDEIPHLSQEPEKVPVDTLCGLRLSRYRKRPSYCYAHNKTEDASDCSGATSIAVKALHVLLVPLLILVVVKQQH